MPQPATVAAVFTALLCVTTTIYFYAKPAGMNNDATSSETAGIAGRKSGGFWGPFDAEFNWCEPDYPSSPLVAEPLNTVTSGLYLVPPLLGFGLMPELLCIETRFVAATLWIFLIGVGSIIFHGTLRYWGQLCDELPMYGLILTAAYIGAFRRPEPSPRAGTAAGVCTVAWCALTAVLFATPRENALHQAARGAMSITFAVGFAFILTVGARVVGEVERDAGPKAGAAVGAVYEVAFWAFVLAILAWACDNFLCAQLHNLPLGLPYPQLHGLVWHVGTAAGLWHMIVTLLFHRHVVLAGNGDSGIPRIRWWARSVPFLERPAN